GSLTPWNQTLSTDFILVGLFMDTKHAALLYTVIFIFFLLALARSALFSVLIHLDLHLHRLMYFLLSQLSLMDLLYMPVTVPEILVSQVTGDHTISPSGCGIQIFFYLTQAGAKFFHLGAMAYDQYAAICRPLHYPLLMSPRVACLLLTTGCWFLGSVDGFMLTSVTMTFPFCGSQEFHHFFCEVPAVTKLSCSDTSLYKTLMYLCCVLMILNPVIVISSSYTSILLTILRMNLEEGWKKALATCSSHMTVVLFLLFYGVAVYTYMLSSSYHTPQKNMVDSVFYTILTPVLNTLIYSFRNKDVTEALK
uniref:G-protein coupled receptors family 1 profile domain-containing protein n=1 Tax=Cavia porcellus TaxID=10141 RepID=H0W241_CAVPO